MPKAFKLASNSKLLCSHSNTQIFPSQDYDNGPNRRSNNTSDVLRFSADRVPLLLPGSLDARKSFSVEQVLHLDPKPSIMASLHHTEVNCVLGRNLYQRSGDQFVGWRLHVQLQDPTLHRRNRGLAHNTLGKATQPYRLTVVHRLFLF
jgi:hypothetical protein